MKARQVLSVALVLMLLTACSSHATTGNADVDKLSTQQLGTVLVNALDEIKLRDARAEEDAAEIARLQLLVQGVQYTDPEFPAIVKVEDDTGRVTFNKPGSYLLLPEALAYPGVTVLPNHSRIEIGGNDALTLTPASLWMYRFEGNKLFLSSTSGIYGEIVVGKAGDPGALNLIDILFDGHPGQEEQRDQYDRLTQPYIPQSAGLIATIPPDPGKSSYRNDEPIFWSNSLAGRQVSFNTSVNEDSAVIRVGLFAVDSIAVLYSFVYDSERDAQHEFAIMALLQTMRVQNRAIEVGF
ncbi:hypothetical protein FACS1894208_00840 [Clostridia bacterium]|nr:hypothetical protein FACS1894208_00840 [Clostridia bacterium]